MSGSIIQGKRYPMSQRTVVLQFGSVEEAEAWDRAGRPIELVWPEVLAPSEDEQHQGDDRQDDQDRPKHEPTVPRPLPRQSDVVEFHNLARPQSKRRKS